MTAEVWASETHAILEWQESSSDSDVLLMDIQSEKGNLTPSRSCHQEKQCTKVGWQQRGSESRQEKSENKNKLLCALHRWKEISLQSSHHHRKPFCYVKMQFTSEGKRKLSRGIKSKTSVKCGSKGGKKRLKKKEVEKH